MKPIRWTPHALQNLIDREIDRAEADKTLITPEFIVPGQFPRMVYMRRYDDALLRQEMLLRVIIEETIAEIVVVSVYKTSQIGRYLRGLIP
ncbi:MAG: hypothetical protein AB7P69_23370 [Candidatus Binatia bacterium]